MVWILLWNISLRENLQSRWQQMSHFLLISQQIQIIPQWWSRQTSRKRKGIQKTRKQSFRIWRRWRDIIIFDLLYPYSVSLHSSRRAKLAPLLLESINMRTNLLERWVEAEYSCSHFYCNVFQQQNNRWWRRGLNKKKRVPQRWRRQRWSHDYVQNFT